VCLVESKATAAYHWACEWYYVQANCLETDVSSEPYACKLALRLSLVELSIESQMGNPCVIHTDHSLHHQSYTNGPVLSEMVGPISSCNRLFGQIREKRTVRVIAYRIFHSPAKDLHYTTVNTLTNNALHFSTFKCQSNLCINEENDI